MDRFSQHNGSQPPHGFDARLITSSHGHVSRQPYEESLAPSMALRHRFKTPAAHNVSRRAYGCFCRDAAAALSRLQPFQPIAALATAI